MAIDGFNGINGKDILKGALAGLVAGLVATAAKTAAEAIYPPRVHGEPDPREEAADRILGPRYFSLKSHTAAGETIHWGFGALAGALYGIAAEVYPAATDKHGASFGLTLAAVTHDGVLPALGLAASPEEQSGRVQTSEMTSHIVYGVVAETVRMAVRELL